MVTMAEIPRTTKRESWDHPSLAVLPHSQIGSLVEAPPDIALLDPGAGHDRNSQYEEQVICTEAWSALS